MCLCVPINYPFWGRTGLHDEIRLVGEQRLDAVLDEAHAERGGGLVLREGRLRGEDPLVGLERGVVRLDLGLLLWGWG